MRHDIGEAAVAVRHLDMGDDPAIGQETDAHPRGIAQLMAHAGERAGAAAKAAASAARIGLARNSES